MKINKILYFVFGLALLLSACEPIEKTYDLGDVASKSELKFSITPSSENPNAIVMKSETDGVIPRWTTPLGASTRAIDTVIIAFPGTYKFVYGALSEGGYIESDTVELVVTTIDEDYVNTPMWINLTGGLGQSKTWKLDVDASGKSKYFAGPMYFAGFNFEWQWDAGWADWIMPAGDYGTMTFDLIGNANITVDNKMLPELSGTGTFMLYPNENKLQTYGVDVIHDATQGANVIDWRTKMTINKLTADQLQLIAVKGDGWSLYNYISQDYFDSH